MQGKYEVTHGGRAVGTVELKLEGLYYRLSCRCQVSDGEIHRLYAGEEKIGVLIPEGDCLVLEIRVASKRLKPDCTFSLDCQEAEFFPIRQGEAFLPLDRIRYGKLSYRNGEPGLARASGPTV